MTPLELGSHPKPTQIADALVYVGDRWAWSPAYPLKALEVYGDWQASRVDKTVDTLVPLTMNQDTVSI